MKITKRKYNRHQRSVGSKIAEGLSKMILFILAMAVVVVFAYFAIWLDWEAYHQRYPHAEFWTYFFQGGK